MQSEFRPTRWIPMLLVLGVLQYFVPPGADAQVSETGPPLAKSVRNAAAVTWGAGAPVLTPDPQARVGWPSPTPPSLPPGAQSLP